MINKIKELFFKKSPVKDNNLSVSVNIDETDKIEDELDKFDSDFNSNLLYIDDHKVNKSMDERLSNLVKGITKERSLCDRPNKETIDAFIELTKIGSFAEEDISMPNIETNYFCEKTEPETVIDQLDQIISQANKLKKITSHHDYEKSVEHSQVKEWLAHVLIELNGQSQSKSSTNKGYVKMLENYNRHLENEIENKKGDYLKAKNICEKLVQENSVAKIAVVSNYSASCVAYEALKDFVNNDERYNESILDDVNNAVNRALSDSNITIKTLALMPVSEILNIMGIANGYLRVIQEAFKKSNLFAVCNLDKKFKYENISSQDIRNHYSRFSDFKYDGFPWLAPSIYYGEDNAITGFNFKQNAPYINSFKDIFKETDVDFYFKTPFEINDPLSDLKQF
jgi:hypothetical protein